MSSFMRTVSSGRVSWRILTTKSPECLIKYFCGGRSERSSQASHDMETRGVPEGVRHLAQVWPVGTAIIDHGFLLVDAQVEREHVRVTLPGGLRLQVGSGSSVHVDHVSDDAWQKSGSGKDS